MVTQQEIDIALIARDILLLTWLIILPWRQRNLREARIGVPPAANIFKAEKPRTGHMALPPSLTTALEENPCLQFWQFSFKEGETKKEHAVRGALPNDLVVLLEPYIQKYRPVLCRDNDPGTLFVTARSYSEMLLSARWPNRSDRDITQQIRQSIVKDESLSTYAHNVKIVWPGHAEGPGTFRRREASHRGQGN